MKKKFTIIGGSGFVGTNLCQRLALTQQNFEIIDIKISKEFPDRYKFGDVRDINSLREAISGDVVINLAALHRDDLQNTKEYKHTNVDGSENVALVCDEKSITKIIFTSTVAVYGFAKPGTDEKGAINPYNEYGRTKFEAEEKLRVWHSKGKKSLIIIRPTVIFGEGNRGNVFNLFKQIKSGNFFMVGTGKNKKSMAYIGNIVAFLETCIRSDCNYGLYNYVDTPDLTMNELVSQVRLKLKGKSSVGLRLPYWLGLSLGYTSDLISFISRKKLPVSSIRVKKFTSSSEFTSSAEELDNFIPPFNLDEAIEKTLEYEFITPNIFK